ncbi:AAA family ATPase [Marinicella sp. S1101]|uniref:AAA family ATPase n=1 Tax=Marinicella marina TaxID=2996016 RepID=UPI002260BB2C|nr:AAA family ATPase [Marinicella marina]MCX7553202.1 AAA family ATPase [Marinicella marina]MDJ1138934.1 AAA family ATPase [Marinicella marina]
MSKTTIKSKQTNNIRVLIFGNSGSGKSTLAKKLSTKYKLAHLDLDTLAWLPSKPPQRRSIETTIAAINAFIKGHDTWVIEGCYADLLAHVAHYANEAIFMNLSVKQCQENAKNRPWESHKYASKADQDANLPMLLDWIAAYETREDEFSYQAHEALYNAFSNDKKQITKNQP